MRRNKPEIIDISNVNLSSLEKKYAHLYFTMRDGTVGNLQLIEGGYVKYN